MKKYQTTFLIAEMALLAATHTAFAADSRGGEADAQEMIKRAVALMRREGAAKAYKAFNEPEGKDFKDKDLFVFVYDFQRNVLANGGNARIVGKNLLDVKDAEGIPFVRGMLDMVKSRTKGWYGPYKFSNPQTQEYEKKKTYSEQAVGETMACVGIYLGR